MSSPVIATLELRQHSPGGSPGEIARVVDKDGRSMSDYTWSDDSRSAQQFCKHGPMDACDCFVHDASTPQSTLSDYDSDEPYTPVRRGRRSSDSTITELPARPFADPKVSPTHLPSLCDQADSDDGLFEATQAEAQNAEGQGASLDTRDLTLLSCATFVHSGAHYSEEEEAIPFNFVPPSDAPTFPPRQRLSDPMISGASILAGLKHPRKRQTYTRPSGDPRYQHNHDILLRMANPNALDDDKVVETHHKLRLASNAPDPDSYAQAEPSTQGSVRAILLVYPALDVDHITPAPVKAFLCPIPGCEALVLHARSAADAHIKSAHWPAGENVTKGKAVEVCCQVDQQCPCATTPLKFGSLGRHILNKHAPQVVSLKCKSCERLFEAVEHYSAHFRECFKEYEPVPEPPLKRQRV